MAIDDLNTGQNGGQSTEFANQNQSQGFGQSQGQSQAFNPQPDPGVGTEELTDDNGLSGQTDADTSLGDDSPGDDGQDNGNLGEDSILPPSDIDDKESDPDLIDPLGDDVDSEEIGDGGSDGQSAA